MLARGHGAGRPIGVDVQRAPEARALMAEGRPGEAAIALAG